MPQYRHLTESVFTWAAPPIKFGLGAIAECGFDLEQLGVHRCLVMTDAGVAATGVIDEVVSHLNTAGISIEIYDRVAVEPTDRSIQEAIDFAATSKWDGFLAVGGGSVIDTAKAVNLVSTHGGSLMDYIVKPVGAGMAPKGSLKPLLAVPTTAGTGSESTAIAVVDLLDLHLKAGISHPLLRPTMAIVDPLVSVTLAPEVTAASGMDVLTHAIESYTARKFDRRPAYQSPRQRVAFAGANPISDMFCERAITLVGRHLRSAVLNGYDLEARYGMMLAAMYAGIGFGNAGTHIPHANAYPVAGQVRNYHPRGYPEMPMVPHGQAVASTAIPAFRFTYPTAPGRHLKSASLLNGRDVDPVLGEEALPTVLRSLMRDINVPRSIGAFGFTEHDVEALAEGTMKQKRQLAASPRVLALESAVTIFRQSLLED